MEKIYYTEEEKQQIMDERKKVIDEDKIVRKTTETPIDYDKLLNDELENENNEIKNTDTRFVLKYPVIKINDINEEEFTTEEKRFKINKKMAGILAGIMMATSIPIIAASTRKNNNSNENSSESISNISTTTSNESSTPSNQTTSIESSIQDELDKYSKIKYLTKDEYVELLKSAEKEMSNTSLTTEELAAFVTEVNKNVISPELKQILIESGVLNKDEEMARRVYLNAAEKVGMAMMNTYTLEANADLVSIPEFAEEFKKIQENSAKIHISKFVSEKSNEYDMYKLLDKTYDGIYNATDENEVLEAYKPVYEYLSIDGAYVLHNKKHMPNNMEEEIYKDVYLRVYLGISAQKNVSSEIFSEDYIYSEECSKSL